jgi:hypothetical protein
VAIEISGKTRILKCRQNPECDETVRKFYTGCFAQQKRLRREKRTEKKRSNVLEAEMEKTVPGK